MNNTSLDGRSIWLEYSGGASKPRMGGENSGVAGESDTLFVGNLGFNTTEEALGQFFSEAGEVRAVRIALNEEGRSRGFGHVEFHDPQSA